MPAWWNNLSKTKKNAVKALLGLSTVGAINQIATKGALRKGATGSVKNAGLAGVGNRWDTLPPNIQQLLNRELYEMV